MNSWSEWRDWPIWQKVVIFGGLGLVALVILIVAVTPDPTPNGDSEKSASRCIKAPEAVANSLESDMKVGGKLPDSGQLVSVYEVRSEEDLFTGTELVDQNFAEGVYFIAGEIDGPGYEGKGDVVTWVSNQNFAERGDQADHQFVWSFNPLARQLWYAAQGASPNWGISPQYEGYQESLRCAETATPQPAPAPN